MYKFSVIIPVYNDSFYANKLINCLKNQTFKDFEVIIVDDCSTDGTASLYKNAPLNINVIRLDKNNGNPSVPRNIGIDKSTGEYLVFIDGDDSVNVDFLNDFNKLLINNPSLEVIYKSMGQINGATFKSSFIKNNNIKFPILDDYKKFCKDYNYHYLVGEDACFMQVSLILAENTLLFNSKYNYSHKADSITTLYKKNNKYLYNDEQLINLSKLVRCDMLYKYLKEGKNLNFDLIKKLKLDKYLNDIKYMDNPKLFSIIVPTYNRSRYIANCVKSILSQTYSNFELIISDDGSTDNTLKIVESFNDSRIKILKSTENKGPSHARNKALDIAIGDYVVFIDSDDTVKPEYLYHMLYGFRNQKTDIIVMNQKVSLPSGHYNFLEHPEFDTGWTWRNVYKRSIIGETRFLENIKVLEDTIFGFEVFYKAKNFYISRMGYYNYNKNNSSLTISLKGTGRDALIKAYPYLMNKYNHSKFVKDWFSGRLDSSKCNDFMFENVSDTNLSKCVGCGACKNICPKNAIDFVEKEDGFYYPTVNNNCIFCKKCISICPMFKKLKDNNQKPKVYAIANESPTKTCSSGGAFSLLAEQVLNKNGYVCGAAWVDDFKVEHILVDNIKDLDKLKYSKYVQSDTSKVYKIIKEKLLKNNYVLYTGTPCQVKGLKNFLGESYDNLITIDLICHGVPSYKYFNNYLKEAFDYKDIETVWTRPKQEWKSIYEVGVTYKDGSSKIINGTESSYIKLFLKDYCLRDSCYGCEFSSLPREGDITIGDLWAIKNVPNVDIAIPNWKNGTSIVLINNFKAQQFFNEITNPNIKELAYNLKYINKNVYEPVVKKDDIYKKSIFTNFINNGYSIKKSVHIMETKKFDVGFAAYCSNNYGSIFVSLAVVEILKALDLSTVIIDMPNARLDGYWFLKDKVPLVSTFSKEITKFVNTNISKLVVGSDISWFSYRVKNIEANKLYMFSTFYNKPKIGIGVSLNEAKAYSNLKDILIKNSKSFKKILTREKSGATFLNSLGIKQVEAIVDPIMVIGKDFLEKEMKLPKETDYILAYFIDYDRINEDALFDLQERYNKKIILIKDLLNPKPTKNLTGILPKPDEFIGYIKNADFIVTDSFHCVIMSLLFNKTFMSLRRVGSQSLKQENIESIFNIKSEDLDNFNNCKSSFEDLDYNYINKIIKKEQNNAWELIKDALDVK